jgi:hypothetical protein
MRPKREPFNLFRWISKDDHSASTTHVLKPRVLSPNFGKNPNRVVGRRLIKLPNEVVHGFVHLHTSASISFVLREPDDTQPNRFTLTLWIFRASLLRLLFRFERFRQRSELASDVLEEQPLFNDFWHGIL